MAGLRVLIIKDIAQVLSIKPIPVLCITQNSIKGKFDTNVLTQRIWISNQSSKDVTEDAPDSSTQQVAINQQSNPVKELLDTLSKLPMELKFPNPSPQNYAEESGLWSFVEKTNSFAVPTFFANKLPRLPGEAPPKDPLENPKYKPPATAPSNCPEIPRVVSAADLPTKCPKCAPKCRSCPSAPLPLPREKSTKPTFHAKPSLRKRPSFKITLTKTPGQSELRNPTLCPPRQQTSTCPEPSCRPPPCCPTASECGEQSDKSKSNKQDCSVLTKWQEQLVSARQEYGPAWLSVHRNCVLHPFGQPKYPGFISSMSGGVNEVFNKMSTNNNMSMLGNISVDRLFHSTTCLNTPKKPKKKKSKKKKKKKKIISTKHKKASKGKKIKCPKIEKKKPKKTPEKKPCPPPKPKCCPPPKPKCCPPPPPPKCTQAEEPKCPKKPEKPKKKEKTKKRKSGGCCNKPAVDCEQAEMIAKQRKEMKKCLGTESKPPPPKKEKKCPDLCPQMKQKKEDPCCPKSKKKDECGPPVPLDPCACTKKPACKTRDNSDPACGRKNKCDKKAKGDSKKEFPPPKKKGSCPKPKDPSCPCPKPKKEECPPPKKDDCPPPKKKKDDCCPKPKKACPDPCEKPKEDECKKPNKPPPCEPPKKKKKETKDPCAKDKPKKSCSATSISPPLVCPSRKYNYQASDKNYSSPYILEDATLRHLEEKKVNRKDDRDNINLLSYGVSVCQRVILNVGKILRGDEEPKK